MYQLDARVDCLPLLHSFCIWAWVNAMAEAYFCYKVQNNNNVFIQNAAKKKEKQTNNGTNEC